MKKKIAILGSTGSIGKSTLKIVKNNFKYFDVILLTTNKNYKTLFSQIKVFNPKNVIINNTKYFKIISNKFKNKEINVYNNFDDFFKKFNKSIDYTMCAISGLSGLKPTINIIKFTKTIGIANKESIICGWNLINKELNRYKTSFVPIDSEHFSIWNLTKDFQDSDIEQIIITASGGPFLNLPKSKFKNISPKNAINHPRWKMGKKISIDSATLMNKVFEIIEALRIFKFNKNKYKILIHPSSYVHAIVKFNNGITKILVHDTNMTIPIFNSIFYNEKKIKCEKINISYLNNLKLSEVDHKIFPAAKLLKKIPNNHSLFETIMVSANDELVNLFLNKKIKFDDIVNYLDKILNYSSFIKYKKIMPKSIMQIENLNHLVRLKTRSLIL